MTETTETPKSPVKKLFWIIAIIFGYLAIDHYSFHTFSGGPDITVTDSTIVISAPTDTVSKVDAVKKDSVR